MYNLKYSLRAQWAHGGVVAPRLHAWVSNGSRYDKRADIRCVGNRNMPVDKGFAAHDAQDRNGDAVGDRGYQRGKQIWIAQPGMNLGQDRQMQMVGGNGKNQFRQYPRQNFGNQNGYNEVQNVRNQNLNPNGNGNVVTVRAEGNEIRNNGNLISKHRHQVLRLTKLSSMTQTDQLSVEQSGGTVEQHPATVEETRAYFESLYNNLQAQQKQQSLYNGKVLLEKHDPPAVYDSEETLQLAQESRLKMKQLNKEIKSANYEKIDHISGVFVSQTTKSREELVQNFEIQFLKEAAKFVRDFKSLAKEAYWSLAKYKALELEIKRLLRAVVSQDIMSIMQSNSVVDTSNLHTELEQYKYNKISYDKAYSDMQQKIERLQAQLGDLNGKSKDTLIHPFKTYMKDKLVSINKVRVSISTNPITVSQPHVISKKDVNSDSNGLSSTGNDKSEVVCAMCKQCLITANHDVCVLNYDNGMNSRAKKQKANVSNTKNQKKQKPNIKKPKKVGSSQRLALPKPSKPSSCLRWSPTGRIFYLKGKIITTSESECQSDSSEGDNACTYNPQEPIRKRFPNSTFSLAGHLNLFMVRRLGMFKAYDGESEASHKFRLEVLGNHPLYLEVAFRRNTCFVINLEGVDLLKGNLTTNLYTINLHEMASASPICLMARATSTKLWLWHQHLSHLNFDTINNLAKNDLVIGLPKFKYHKEHLCPSCEQGKGKKASHPSKPVPNSEQRLHLLHMDLCGPMRVESINRKWYVLVIVDDYSRYTWVHFLRSKDEAPEVIKIFLKKITVLLQAPVISVRTDNNTEFKNQVLQENFNSVGISHQASSVRTPQQNRVMERRNRTLVGAARTIVYKRRTKKIMETMNVTFDELSAMAFEQRSSKPGLQSMTSGHISSGLDLTYAPSTITTQQPTERNLALLFESMYDDYIGGQPLAATRTVPAAQAPQLLQTLTSSTTTANTAPTPKNSSSQATHIPNTSHDVEELKTQQQHL
ncbi:retrovirus-related pol polyprotein from transposon TNT 1-94 [Tanacetum coccineum]